jgi:hypothetical protein
MISRLRCASALTPVLVVCALLTAACQKVPLLAPSGSTITLTASATALPVNGSTDIIAQVIEAGGTPPHSGTLVSFTTNLGSVQPSQAETDISGKVIVKYVAGTGSGTATITAISGGVSASGTNAIKIAVGAAAVGGIALSANPTTLPAIGGTTTITAVVNDGGGNSLAGVPVTFSTDAGSLGLSSVPTDANGRATTTLTTGRTAKVTATAGVATTSGTTTTAASSNTITITVNSTATIVLGAPTPSPAVVGQPVSWTLTVTPSASGGAIQSVVVNFGDGRSQSLGPVSGATSLSHTYDSSGTYTVTATATDSNGDSFPAVSQVVVTAKPTPATALTVNKNPSTLADQPLTFTATVTQLATGVTVDRYDWSFGDGLTRTTNSSTTTHAYAAGNWTAVVTAVMSDGARSTSSIEVKVN